MRGSKLSLNNYDPTSGIFSTFKMGGRGETNIKLLLSYYNKLPILPKILFIINMNLII